MSHTELDFTGDPISYNGLFPTSAQKEVTGFPLGFPPEESVPKRCQALCEHYGFIHRFVTAHTRLRGEDTLSFVLGYTYLVH